jgi:hypothetical protein
VRYINLLGSGGPTNLDGTPDTVWTDQAKILTEALVAAAQDKATRDTIIDTNDLVWKRLRDWLLRLSYDKCWYSESRDFFSVLEVEHYRPKKRCKRVARGLFEDGYWWLAFEWSNYRLCGKVGNAKKGDFFPLAASSPTATYGGLSILNEIPLLLDPACPGDPDLLSFDEDGQCGPHADADQFTTIRVTTTVARVNLNHGRITKARQRIWNRCRQLIEECRELALQLEQAPGPADRQRLNDKKEELRAMTRPEAEFSSVAKVCLLKSNIHWAQMLATG